MSDPIHAGNDVLNHLDTVADMHRMVENSDDFPIVIVQNWPLELNRLVR